MLTAGRSDWIHLVVVGEPIVSDVSPSQLVAWHAFNWTGGDPEGPVGEWLRCLKGTRARDRQLIWSEAAVAGVVTFAGWVRRAEGFYEAWGSAERLPQSVDRKALLADPRTAPRFDELGIKALQGSPITLTPELAAALSEMADGVPASDVPLDDPDYDEEPILWVGLHGLRPEAYIEAEIAAQRRLWRKLEFPHAPVRQRRLGTAGRVDLLAGDVVGEAKRAVTVRDGPDQIERYLDYLKVAKQRPASKLRGILLQGSSATSRAVERRLAESPYRLELWAVLKDTTWNLERLA